MTHEAIKVIGKVYGSSGVGWNRKKGYSSYYQDILSFRWSSKREETWISRELGPKWSIDNHPISTHQSLSKGTAMKNKNKKLTQEPNHRHILRQTSTIKPHRHIFYMLLPRIRVANYNLQ